jgi:hypothetical protein
MKQKQESKTNYWKLPQTTEIGNSNTSSSEPDIVFFFGLLGPLHVLRLLPEKKILHVT